MYDVEKPNVREGRRWVEGKRLSSQTRKVTDFGEKSILAVDRRRDSLESI